MKAIIFDLNYEIKEKKMGSNEIITNYYITHISYIIYDFDNLKILLTQCYDIDLYHRAQRILNKRDGNVIISNNKIRHIIAIINYYLKLCDVFISYDIELVKKILNEESNRNSITCEIETSQISMYCVLEIYKKIFNNHFLDLKNNTSYNGYLNEGNYYSIYNNKTHTKLYVIYLELFKLSYLYNITHCFLNCLLIMRIYYKFVTSHDIEYFDMNIKRLRIMNS